VIEILDIIEASMTGCLDDNEASEFASGSLAQEAAGRIERHLATCRDCRALVATLAPGPGDGDADSDVITSPRRVALGKRRGHLAHASTERPHPPPEPTTQPRARRSPTDPVIAAGDTIGRYIILARLGAGGMGVVYTAYDPQLDRKVALKLLRTGTVLGEAEARSRLIREAQAIAQLSHPNVVAVYDVGTAITGDVYIAMELVEGETLTSWLGHWDRSWREILELFFQAGRGLAAAHARGLVHRDFKPDNVLVGSDGRVRVTDFGLARSLIDQVDELARDHPRPELEALRATLTATGTVLGTPRYMAPEQLRGADADARSDQFSLCVALYEALYDRHPLPGDSIIDVVQHGAEPRPPPAESKVPVAIGRAIMRGLSTDPIKRFPALAALLVELTPAPVHPRRRQVAAVLGGVALAAGGAAAAMYAQSKLADDLSGERDAIQRERDHLVDEVHGLRDEIQRILYADGGLADKSAKVHQLEREVAVREVKIQELEEKLVTAQDAGAAPARARPRTEAAPRAPSGVPEPAFAAALAARRGAIESCVREWMEREPDRGATIVVTFTVAPDGTVRSTLARGLDDSQTPACVERAVARAQFPPAAAITAGELTAVVERRAVRITWRKTGAANPGQIIDF